jgi:ATP-dependent Clp protease protease subunit
MNKLVNWSINKNHISRKRKYEDDDESYEYRLNKKAKYVLQDDEMIYTIGTEIHFTADINKETIEKMIKMISNIIDDNADETDELTIAYIVDSPGGCVNSVLKFVDYINMVRDKYPHVKFISIVTGLVASAGTIMSIVADKRLMTKHAHAMIHELSSGNSGKYTQLISYTKFLTELHNTLLDIYLEHSKKDKREMESILNTETWFNAQEYLEHGFIDEIK